MTFEFRIKIYWFLIEILPPNGGVYVSLVVAVFSEASTVFIQIESDVVQIFCLNDI